MHRCLYGIVHPDDHHEVKMVLEQTIIDPRCQAQDKSNNFIQQMQHEAMENVNRMQFNHATHITPKAVSFLCRMKCFNGTATGYLKMHCSGHMHSLPNALKSTRTSCQVVFAYCRPFMLSNNDPESDLKQNVFWSKHEMDLTFKQLDKKSIDVIGFTTEDIDGKSFYSFVHPEDLATCIACHKAFTESQEIQTMYFRFMCKNGNWIWLHTRGKVVFKNSKKYSVVFSHCPVREEDSTYIQQEVMLRTRYAIQDLMYSTSLQQWGDRTDVYQELNQSHNTVRAVTRYHPFGGLREEDANSLHSPHGTCPSSWHSNSDRHSPVFPSTHMPHKYFQRERQFHMEEIKRKAVEKEMQGMELVQSPPTGHQGVYMHHHLQGPALGQLHGSFPGQLQGPVSGDTHCPPQESLARGMQTYESLPFHTRHLQVSAPLNGHFGSPAMEFPTHFGGHPHENCDSTSQMPPGSHSIPPPQYGSEFSQRHPMHPLPQTPAHLPLSPPPSPSPHYLWKTVESPSRPYVAVGEHRYYNSGPQYSLGGESTVNNNRHWHWHGPQLPHFPLAVEETSQHVNVSTMRHDPRRLSEDDLHNHEYQAMYRHSHNHIQSPLSHSQHNHIQSSLMHPGQPLHSMAPVVHLGQSPVVYLGESPNGMYPESCAIHLNDSPQGHPREQSAGRHAASDIDMSSHMKIVEEGSGSQVSSSRTSTQPVNTLPSVGSFLEYLNDV